MSSPPKKLNWKGAPAPERVTLKGAHVNVVPLNAADHTAALYDLIKDPSEHFIWDYMPTGPYLNPEDFAEFMTGCESSPDPFFFTILRKRDGMPVGVFSLLNINPAHGTIEVGYIWFTKALRRTVGATEAIYLLTRYAMTTLGYRRYEWKCNNLNKPSKRAAMRFGFTFEGIFRQHFVMKDRSRDSAWYSIIDSEWPAIDAAYLAWLDPANFDEDGVQKKSLREFVNETGRFNPTP